MTQTHYIEARLQSYDALLAQQGEAFDSPGIARLAQSQRMYAANDAAHIAQAFNDAADYMEQNAGCTSLDIQTHLANTGFDPNTVYFVMSAFDEVAEVALAS